MTPLTPGQRTAAEVEDQISAAVDGLCACGCRQPLPDDAPSAYFIGEGHQKAWAMRNAKQPTEVLSQNGLVSLQDGVAHLTLPPEWAHLAGLLRDEVLNDAERTFDEMSTRIGPAPVWRQMSEGEIQSTYDTMHEIESRLAGVRVVTSPLIPPDQIIMCSGGTPVAMVNNLAQIAPKTPEVPPRRPWWRRLLWWRNR